MDIKTQINEGDAFTLKKQHPCKSYTWRVLRAGADIKLKCEGCGHIILVDREKFNKIVRSKA
jgi:hypothetical protein